MKLLVAIKSTVKDRDKGAHDLARASWATLGSRADVRFFHGEPPVSRVMRSYAKDEVGLRIPDTEQLKALKTQIIATYMRGKQYDYMFLAGLSLGVNVEKLLTCRFENYDYSGYVSLGRISAGEQFQFVDQNTGTFYPLVYPWAEASRGYFLSRRAALEVADTYPGVPREDMFVGQVLGPLVARAEMSAESLDLEGVTWDLSK